MAASSMALGSPVRTAGRDEERDRLPSDGHGGPTSTGAPATFAAA